MSNPLFSFKGLGGSKDSMWNTTGVRAPQNTQPQPNVELGSTSKTATLSTTTPSCPSSLNLPLQKSEQTVNTSTSWSAPPSSNLKTPSPLSGMVPLTPAATTTAVVTSSYSPSGPAISPSTSSAKAPTPPATNTVAPLSYTHPTTAGPTRPKPIFSASLTGAAPHQVKTSSLSPTQTYSSAAGGKLRIAPGLDRFQFCEKVRHAIEQAQKRSYAAVYAMTCRFLNDDTQAVSDCASFKNSMKICFGISTEEAIWDAGDVDLSETAEEKIVTFVKSFERNIGRKLFFFHFAGHGEVDASGNLVLLADRTGLPKLPFLPIQRLLRDGNSYSNRMADVDVLEVIDCCYSGAASRDSTGTRIVEVFAACTEAHTTNSRDTAKGPTFTAMFCSELSFLKNSVKNGMIKTTVRTPLLHEGILRRSLHRAQPIRMIVKGVHPIVLPFKCPAEASLTSPVFSGPGVTVAFHLDDSYGENAVREVEQWIGRMPRALQLTWQGDIPSTSAIIFIAMPLELYWFLEADPAFTLVGPANLEPLLVDPQDQMIRSTEGVFDIPGLQSREGHDELISYDESKIVEPWYIGKTNTSVLYGPKGYNSADDDYMATNPPYSSKFYEQNCPSGSCDNAVSCLTLTNTQSQLKARESANNRDTDQ